MFLTALLTSFFLQGSEPDCEVIAKEARTYADQTRSICEVLVAQQMAWNSGDIPGFMAGYWNSPDLRFASGGSITRGWQPTMEGYEDRYDTPEKMGRLEFSDLTIDVLSNDAAIVFGRWTLERDSDQPSGLFTLVFRQYDEMWLIVSDHTSSAD